MQLPMYCWAMLGTSILVVLSTPVLAGTLVLLSFDIVAHTGFFNPTLGGNVVVYQHLFWFYSHPAVYIMVLPAFGLVSEILPVHARKPLFGYVTMVYSIMAIVGLGLIVWAHHMFTSGTPPWMRLFFTIAHAFIAVPTGIKFFNWLTLWGEGSASTVPVLFSCGFIVNFVLGGITGVALAQVPFDIHVHDTYFVVAHFHYIVFGGSVFVIFASIYWYPKFTGRMLHEVWDDFLRPLHIHRIQLVFWSPALAGPEQDAAPCGRVRPPVHLDQSDQLRRSSADGHQHTPLLMECDPQRPGWRPRR